MVKSPLHGQTIYVDANTLIYAVEAPNLFPGLQNHFVQPFIRGDLKIVTSWITLAEVLVKPIQSGDAKLETYYRQLIRQSESLSVVMVDDIISSAAAQLRAHHAIKLPDAIHLATGMTVGCTCFLTGDTGWAKTGMNIIDPASH